MCAVALFVRRITQQAAKKFRAGEVKSSRARLPRRLLPSEYGATTNIQTEFRHKDNLQASVDVV